MIKKNQTMVEWAVVLPFFILMLVSILELAPLMNSILKVEKAAQYGARIGAIRGSKDDDIKDAVVYNLQGIVDNSKLNKTITYSDPNISSTGIVAYRQVEGSIDKIKIEISPADQSERINGAWVLVRITYNYELYTPVLRTLLQVNGGLLNNRYFPIVRYSIQKIE